MMVTITNVTGTTFPTGFTLNALDALTGGSGPSGLNATGGARTYPLPFPFAHIGSLAAAATKLLVMKPRDFHKGGSVPYSATMEPGEEWQQMIQSGLVTLTTAAEATSQDPEETFIAVV